MKRALTILASVAVLAAGTVPIADGASSRRYAGETKQGERISLRSERRGVTFRLNWTARCQSAGRFTGTTATKRRAPLRRRRTRFALADTYGESVPGGRRARVSVNIQGKLSKRQASGRWRAVAIVYNSGKATDRCDTGVVSWSAKRR